MTDIPGFDDETKLERTRQALEALDTQRTRTVAARNHLIRRLHKAGLSMRQIGEIAGLSGNGVHNVIHAEDQ